MKQRAGPIMEVIRAAAPGDAEISALWRRIETEFHANQRQLIESLYRKHALRKGLGVAAAADILWALNHLGVTSHHRRPPTSHRHASSGG